MPEHETTTVAVVPEMALVATPKEQRLLAELLQSSAPNAAALETELEPEVALERLEILCRLSETAEKIADLSKPVIGRLLLTIQMKPSFYKGLGYKNFNEFLERHVVGKFGLRHTTACNAMRIMRKFPDLSPEVFRKIGTVKTVMLTKAFPGETAVPKRYLALAQQMTAPQLRERLDCDKLLEAGEDQPFLIQISTNKAVGQRWWEFVKREEIRRYCETDRADEILLHLIEECEQRWVDEADNEQRLGTDREKAG